MPCTFKDSNNPICSNYDKYVRSAIMCDICNKWSHTTGAAQVLFVCHLKIRRRPRRPCTKCNNLTPT